MPVKPWDSLLLLLLLFVAAVADDDLSVARLTTMNAQLVVLLCGMALFLGYNGKITDYDYSFGGFRLLSWRNGGVTKW